MSVRIKQTFPNGVWERGYEKLFLLFFPRKKSNKRNVLRSAAFSRGEICAKFNARDERRFAHAVDFVSSGLPQHSRAYVVRRNQTAR